jgi:hypothetical protein
MSLHLHQPYLTPYTRTPLFEGPAWSNSDLCVLATGLRPQPNVSRERGSRGVRTVTCAPKYTSLHSLDLRHVTLLVLMTHTYL